MKTARSETTHNLMKAFCDGQLTSITTLALTGDALPLMFAMKNAAQVGLTSLYIFQHMFKAKFELLGIRAEMDALRRVGL
jgi:predicted AlkP superfamily phosphohydrolase/phosphomutase